MHKEHLSEKFTRGKGETDQPRAEEFNTYYQKKEKAMFGSGIPSGRWLDTWGELR